MKAFCIIMYLSMSIAVAVLVHYMCTNPYSHEDMAAETKQVERSR